MDSISVLPDTTLAQHGKVTQAFLNRGIRSFQAACRWTRDLPYGFNSRRESMVVFEEGRGTCTTKHGIIARLAEEQSLAVHKHLVFYRLDDSIVTGVGDIIGPAGLAFIPQAHCILKYGPHCVDLTAGNCNGKNKSIDTWDFIIKTDADLSSEQEREHYLEVLERYFPIEPRLKSIGSEGVLTLLEHCNHHLKSTCSLLGRGRIERC
ncbi:MAG: hypothetical protein ACLFTB_09535 [Desulfovibrionales bacterium]